jgi:hypothetical protein
MKSGGKKPDPLSTEPLKEPFEYFQFAGAAYNVTKALELVKDREPEGEIDPTVWADAYIGPEGKMSTGVSVNWDHVDEVDLNKPILLAWYVSKVQSGNIVIDGYHRLAKGRRLGVKQLRAYVLTEEESSKVRMR